MSEILKARNRIMNRHKPLTTNTNPQPQPNFSPASHQHQQSPQQPFTHQLLAEQTFDLQPITSFQYPKKFNISSISMKFAKHDFDQQLKQRSQQSQSQIIYEAERVRGLEINSNSNMNSNREDYRREKSPEFSRTERINPIRHFQPNNMNTLSESNSRSGIYQRFGNKRVSRKVGSLKQNQFQLMYHDDKSSIVKSTLQPPLHHPSTQSPIRKIRKTIHPQQCILLIAKQQRRRAQSPYKPRECLKSFVEEKMEQIMQERDGRFSDEEFPARLTIMYPQKGLGLREEFGVEFLSLKEVYDRSEVKVALISTCEPTHLLPGYFTNPFLYSAIRILAEHPSRILSLFQNQSLNEHGAYYIRLCKDGTWRYILIDDMVPVKKHQEQYSYDRNGGSSQVEVLCLTSEVVNNAVEIWPALVEKAVAKIYGTYYDLSMSRRDGICPLLRLLTGYPVSKYDLIKDIRSYLILIDSALKRSHIVILQQILPQFQHLAQLKNLSTHQSYQILQISKNNFVLRNINELDLVTRVTFDEVMMFSSLLIFRREEGYGYVSQKLRHKMGYYSVVKVRVEVTTQGYWDVWQNNPAYYKNHCDNKIQYQVSPFKILIHPLLSHPTSQYDSVQQPQTIVQSGKQITMKKGEYLVTVHLCQQLRQMDFTLTYYGQKEVTIERIKNTKVKWGESCCGGNSGGEKESKQARTNPNTARER